MAQFILVTTFTDPSKWETGTADAATGAAKTILLNVSRILTIQTRPTAFRTTGVTNILYVYPKNEATQQVTFIVTEIQSALLTAVNATS